MKRKGLILLMAVIVLSCNREPEADTSTEGQNLSQAMAILYNHYSSEYKALSYQAYNIASSRLFRISDTAKSISSLAVIVDIDETILDNSPYQAKASISNFAYPEGWNKWCNAASAESVPGAMEFLLLADSLGFKIFYLSNRKNDYVYKGTYDNLKNIGFPQVDQKSLLLREAESKENPDPSDKEARREIIRNMGYEIVLLAGDNLGDFFTDNSTGNDRDMFVKDLYAEFGNRFIVLPNAMYGNWPAAIGLDGSQESILVLLEKMSKIY